jgi:M6 family metalloprotease-like protein
MRFKPLLLLLLILTLLPVGNHAKAQEYNIYVIPVSFPDYPPDFTLDEAMDFIFEFVDAYLPEVSYYRTNVNLDYYPEWIELDQTMAYYNEGSERTDELIRDAMNALPDVDLQGYDIIVVLHAGDNEEISLWEEDLTSASSYGKEYLTYSGGTIRAGWALLSEWDEISQVAHHMLHAMGLPELFTETEDFADGWDPMGPEYVNLDTMYIPPHPNVAFKMQLGWLNEEEVMRIGQGEATVTLVGSSLEDPGIKAVVIPISGSESYVLEARVFYGYDDVLPDEGVLIWHKVGSMVRIVDAHPETEELDDATLIEGESYLDVARGISISVIGSDPGFSYTVSITSSPGVIVDEIIYPEGRFDVGSTVTIYYHAVRQLDGSPIAGYTALVNGQEITFNSTGWAAFTVSSRQAGIVQYGIDEIRYEGRLIPFSTEVGAPTIVWDRVIIEEISLDRDKGNVGYSPLVTVYAYYEADHTPLVNGQVYVNDLPLTYNETLKAWQARMPASESIGTETYRVTDVVDEEYGLTGFLDLAGSLTFAWDRIVVELSPWHGDVSAPANVTINAYFESDHTPFEGLIEVNGTKAERLSPGLYYALLTSPGKVAEALASVTAVQDYEYNITAYTSSAARLIWDEVIVADIDSSGERVDVGSTVTVTTTLLTAYTEEPFDGQAFINGIKASSQGQGRYSITYMKEEVGSEEFRVTSVRGGSYDLTTLAPSPSVKVVWDRVRVTLSTPVNRVSVGSEAPIEVQAYYEYDNVPFKGKVNLNGPTKRNEAGTFEYTVSSIEDRAYGLTAFVSNRVTITFDRPIANIEVSNPSPGTARVEVRIGYEASGEPVEGLQVSINGIDAEEEEPGLYVANIATWSPSIQVNVKAPGIGYEGTASAQLQTNILTMALPIVAIMALATAFLALRRGKKV